MAGGSSVTQLQFCQAAVLNGQPIKEGAADIPFLGSAPRGNSRNAEEQVGKREEQGQKRRVDHGLFFCLFLKQTACVCLKRRIMR